MITRTIGGDEAGVSLPGRTIVRSLSHPPVMLTSMTFHYVPATEPTDGSATPTFCVTLASGRVAQVVGADCYQPEGPLTTFFLSGSSSRTIDVWSERVASFRTADIVSIRQERRSAPRHPAAQNLHRSRPDPAIRPALAVVPA